MVKIFFLLSVNIIFMYYSIDEKQINDRILKNSYANSNYHTFYLCKMYFSSYIQADVVK